MEKKYSRTNIYLIDDDLWKWAKFRADTLSINSVSEYLFELIKIDQKNLTMWLTQDEYDALNNTMDLEGRGLQEQLLSDPMVQDLLEQYQEEDDLSLGDQKEESK